MAEMTAAETPARGDLLGHPPATSVIAATELWVALSIYGVQALLVLYMAETLFLPDHVAGIVGFAPFRAIVEGVTGPLSNRALAAQVFGLFLGLCYLTPLLGGRIGDGATGRRRTVVVGALLMAGGYFALAFDRSFLVALGLLAAGRGGVTGNLVPQLGAAYRATDRRSADGFQIYYTMINLGAFIAPVATGVLAVVYGWHLAFALAGGCMLAAAAVYLFGQRHLPAEAGPHREKKERVPLTKEERVRVKALLVILPLSTVVWIAQTQVWNVYNLWVTDHVDLTILGWKVPVPWFQAFDALAPLAMVPLLIAAWRWQARRSREPDDLGKMTIGGFLFAAGMAWLAAAPVVANAAGKIPLLYVLLFHVISNAGWLYFVPPAASLYTKASPAAVAGVLVAVNTLAVSFASTTSGRLGGLYEKLSPSQFWLLHAVLVGAGSAIFWLGGARLRRALQVAPA